MVEPAERRGASPARSVPFTVTNCTANSPSLETVERLVEDCTTYSPGAMRSKAKLPSPLVWTWTGGVAVAPERALCISATTPCRGEPSDNVASPVMRARRPCTSENSTLSDCWPAPSSMGWASFGIGVPG